MKNSKNKKSQNKFLEIFSPEEYKEIMNSDIHTSKKIISEIRNDINILDANFYQKDSSKKKIQTSEFKVGVLSNKVNEMVGGGFISGKFYLLYGKYSSGKTQICHNLCVSLFDIFKKKNMLAKSLYIDTEDTFRPERIIDIAEKGYNLNGTDILKTINVLKAKSTSNILFHLNNIIREGLNPEVKLILLDSITKHVRIDLGDKEISNIQIRKRLKNILQILFDIKTNNNIPIIITSQVTGIPSDSSSFSVRPVMGYLLNEYVEESILLSHNETGNRFGFLVNSTNLPEQNIEFNISQKGVIDSK